MELLESQDPQKLKLIETSDRHKRALEKELHDLTRKSERMITNALIIGGSLALTYFIVSSLSGRKKKRKNKLAKTQTASLDSTDEVEVEHDQSPSLASKIGARVMDQATFLILEIAKEKLFEYLESRKKADENS